jgi:hypothetical protein
LLALTAVAGLMQLAALISPSDSVREFVDWKRRPVQFTQLTSLMDFACPVETDSLSLMLSMEASLSGQLTDGLESAVGDSLATLACRRTRIGVRANPPDRERFLMSRQSSWHVGAIRSALAALDVFPDHHAALRALAYASVAEAFDGLPASWSVERAELVATAADRLSHSAERGITDPIVLMSCTHLGIVLERRATAFRCALAGAVASGDRSWYLSRIAWTLAQARLAEAAKAVLRLAASEANAPADRAELAYVLLSNPESSLPADERTWIDREVTQLEGKSREEIMALLLRLQPLGWRWRLVEVPPRHLASCQAPIASGTEVPDIEVVQLWNPVTRRTDLIAFGRLAAGSPTGSSGRLIVWALSEGDSRELGSFEVRPGLHPRVLWSAPFEYLRPSLGAWTYEADYGAESAANPVGLIAALPSGREPQLSDLVLIPGAHELQYTDDGVRIQLAEEPASDAEFQLYSQIRSDRSIANTRLVFSVDGCEAGIYRNMISIEFKLDIGLGVNEVRRTLNLSNLRPGDYQLKLVLRGSTGENLSVTERSFRLP